MFKERSEARKRGGRHKAEDTVSMRSFGELTVTPTTRPWAKGLANAVSLSLMGLDNGGTEV